MIDRMIVLHGSLPHIHYIKLIFSFNCLLPVFECQNYAPCNEFDGKCKCPPGFGGDDCLQPGTYPSPQLQNAINLVTVCDSLADGPNRHVRPGDQQKCECKDG